MMQSYRQLYANEHVRMNSIRILRNTLKNCSNEVSHYSMALIRSADMNGH